MVLLSVLGKHILVMNNICFMLSFIFEDFYNLGLDNTVPSGICSVWSSGNLAFRYNRRRLGRSFFRIYFRWMAFFFLFLNL